MIILALMTGLLFSATVAGAAPSFPDYNIVDLGPELRSWEATPERIQGEFGAFTAEELKAAKAEAMAAVVGTPYEECALDAKLWLSLDNYAGVYFFDWFYLIGDTELNELSTMSEIWIQIDLSYPEGDPRPVPEITCEQAAYLLDEFDNNMYPVESAFFGTADFHDGTYSLLEAWGYVPPGYYADTAGKQVVLVSNIGDDNYYDPDYPNYIAGFYSSTFEAYFDRNIMSIDSHQWEERVGPDGARPYLYEGVFAHEYQHLLHDDYDPDEENFVNEGLSMFAEFLTGYVHGNDAYSTFEALPENSLVAWGDQGGREIVADYGIVFLYQMYLYEKFGQEFIQAEFNDPANGMWSLEGLLAGVGTNFADVYHDFSVAVLIDTEDEYGFEFGDVAIDIGHKGKRNPDAYDTPGAPPWGTDYYLLWGYESLVGFEFNGVPFNPAPWSSDGDVLYSGTGDLIDNFLIFETTGGGTLSFDTYWDIEDYWDFGFVQVSTDGGYTWTSLANAETTSSHDPSAHPNIVANLPGLTGWSGDWVTLSYDLSGYTGDILVAFRYMTDWATTYEGWFIDNIYVDTTLISDGSSLDAFQSLAELMNITNDYTITLVAERNRKGDSEYAVKQILSDDYVGSFADFKDFFDNYRTVVMLVTFDAVPGETNYADYSFDFINDEGEVFKNK
jgi:hypothetical protein